MEGIRLLRTPEKFTDDLLTRFSGVSLNDSDRLMAEGEGFEPPDLSINGFQDRRLKPLGHPSADESSLASQALSRSS